jgi:hypothetical protein
MRAMADGFMVSVLVAAELQALRGRFRLGASPYAQAALEVTADETSADAATRRAG